MSSSNNNNRQQQPLIHPINTGTVLSDTSLDDHLIGKPPAARVINSNLHDGLTQISAFLRQHQFLSSSTRNENADGGNSSTAGLSNIYGPILDDFIKSQYERQAAGLRTNTNGASAASVKKVVDSHKDALQYGLDTIATKDAWLNESNICTVHSKLCPDIPQSGRYRENKVRAASTLFTRPEKIREEMNKFEIAMKRFQTKWASSSTAILNDTQWCEQVYQKIAIVAIVVFGINDIHPFQDGNGRTGRIYMNIALKKLLGLPFPIITTATLQQRGEFVGAIKDCRTRLQNITTQQPASRSRANPVFEKLIAVVFDRVLQAVRQVNTLVQARTEAAAIEEEGRIARRTRERSAEGQCVICLDDSPNISTLCCGQVVHMTCLAEWLSNQGTCIGCRRPMPRLIQRTQQQNNTNNNAQAAAAGGGGGDETEDTTDITTMDDTTTEHDDAPNVQEDTTDDTTTMDDTTSDDNAPAAHDTTDDTTTMDDTTNDVPNVQEDTTDYTTTMDDTTSDNAPAAHDTTDDTTTMDDTTELSTTDETAQPPARRSVFCGQCQRNRFAIDCTNNLCGSCCQLYGQMSCARHNCF